MIGQTQIIVQAPDQSLFSSEYHPVTYFTFQLGEHKITFCLIGILPERTHIYGTLIKYVHIALDFKTDAKVADFPVNTAAQNHITSMKKMK